MADRLLVAGERLAALRAEQLLTQEEFADRLGMSTAGIRRLERAPLGGIQIRNFRALAELTGLSPQALRARIGPPHWWVLPAPGEARMSPAMSSFIGSCLTGGALTDRPVIESAPALNRLNAVERDADDAVPQPVAWRGRGPEPVVEMERYHGVSASRTDERAAVLGSPVYAPAGALRRFSVMVDGDCMEPRYRHGDVVIFSVEAAEREGIVEGRNYFVQLADGQNTFKRLFFVPDDADRLLLCCWNPAYPPKSIERRDITLLARAEYRLIPDEATVHGK